MVCRGLRALLDVNTVDLSTVMKAERERAQCVANRTMDHDRGESYQNITGRGCKTTLIYCGWMRTAIFGSQESFAPLLGRNKKQEQYY